MKRVIPFFELYDEIPVNSKFLSSVERKIVIAEATEQNSEISTLVTINYYEVDAMDFEELVNLGFFKKTMVERLNEFNENYQK